MACSRRAFLKKMFYISLGSALPFPAFSWMTGGGYSGGSFSIDPFAFTSLINFDDCMKCKVDGTCKIIFPKIRYWSPVGFIEAAPQFALGVSSKNLGFMSTLAKPITYTLSEAVADFMPRSSFTIGEVRGSETYMKVYPHFIGFPPLVGEAIKGIAGTIETGDLACLCTISGEVGKRIIPGSKFLDAIDEVSEIDGVDSSSLSSISGQYSTALNYVPFLMSEFLMNAWDDEKFLIDRYTIMPFLRNLHEAITKSSLPIGKLACPYITENLDKFGIDIPDKLDLKFLCVGHWGYGYPRSGIVRHDDPIIAGLLAIARFHHLFSKTIPILKKIKYSSKKVKYQLYNPKKSDCFKPGYFSTDPIANKLMEASDPDNITEFISNPQKIKNEFKEIKDWNMPSLKDVKPKKNKRFAGIVVWYKDKKCCV